MIWGTLNTEYHVKVQEFNIFWSAQKRFYVSLVFKNNSAILELNKLKLCKQMIRLPFRLLIYTFHISFMWQVPMIIMLLLKWRLLCSFLFIHICCVGLDKLRIECNGYILKEIPTKFVIKKYLNIYWETVLNTKFNCRVQWLLSNLTAWNKTKIFVWQ